MNTYGNIVYTEALNNGIPPLLASFIAAQAAHETGNFTSAIFTDCNNAFGYKAVRSSCSLHSSYQNYPSIQASTDEICQWIYRRLNEGNFPPLANITNPTQYAQLLSDNDYYEDSVSNYAAGIIAYLDNNIGTAGGIGFFLLAGLALFFLYKNKKAG